MKSSIILLILVQMCYQNASCQDELTTEKRKLSEVYVGFSHREGLHLGFLIGNNTSIGGYVGIGASNTGSPSFGINLKHNFQARYDHKYTDSPFFIRLGAGGGPWPEYAYRYREGALYGRYLAYTFGRDIHFSRMFGFSLELGMMYDFEKLVIIGPILPAFGVKFFYHLHLKK